jgi:hypothetical protein
MEIEIDDQGEADRRVNIRREMDRATNLYEREVSARIEMFQAFTKLATVFGTVLQVSVDVLMNEIGKETTRRRG